MSVDVLQAHGTVVSDPNNSGCFGAMSNPNLCNDGNDGTRGQVGANVCASGTTRGAMATLDGVYVIDAVRIKSEDSKSTASDEWFYSNDGVTWSGGLMGGGGGIPGSWSSLTNDGVFTPTTPIKAKYHRYDRLHLGGFGAPLTIYTWELRGVAAGGTVAVVHWDDADEA